MAAQIDYMEIEPTGSHEYTGVSKKMYLYYEQFGVQGILPDRLMLGNMEYTLEGRDDIAVVWQK